MSERTGTVAARVHRRLLPVALVVSLVACTDAAPPLTALEPEAAKRGAYLATAANCASCHTRRGGQPFAGGRALETPFGVFFAPNITPDSADGIGRWNFADFRRAVRWGVSPRNEHYYPVFPYTSYTGMSDDDIADLWAYLRMLPPISGAGRTHELGLPYNQRLAMVPWKLLFLYRGPLEPLPSQSEEWNRGRYLVTSVAHCADCHSPRNMFGGIDRNRFMAGTRGTQGGVDFWDVPNITPDLETGLGRWSVDDIAALLAGRGMRGMHVGGPMREVVANTSRLTEADRRAMAVYLKSVPPRYGVVKPGAGMCCR